MHVICCDGEFYYRRSTDGGQTWESQAELVPVDSMPAQIWNRPFASDASSLYFVWGIVVPLRQAVWNCVEFTCQKQLQCYATEKMSCSDVDLL